MAGAAEGIGTIALLVGVTCYFTGVLDGVGPVPDRHATVQRPSMTISIDRTAMGNQIREEFISRLVAAGAISSVVISGTTPEVSTGPAWTSLTSEDQQSAMGQIAAQYAELDDCLVRLKNGQTGQPLGTFSRHNGGLRYD